MVGSIATSPALDLAGLPAPTIIDQPDFEARLAGKLAQLIGQYPAFSALVESDPAMKLLQADSYDEMVLTQAFVDAAKGLLLAYATGDQLDHLAALFGVARLVLVEADPETGTAAVMEGDTAFKQRVQLAPHSFSVAGPELAYVFHARSAHADVADATATSPRPDDIRALVLQTLSSHSASPELVAAMTAALDAAAWPGQVDVTVLASTGNGVPANAVLDAVRARLAGPVRPLTDEVIVQPVTLVPYTIEAQLYVFAGPDAELIRQTAQDSLDAHLAVSRRLGRDVSRTAHIAALHVANVQRVVLPQPAADIAITAAQLAHPVSISVTIAGTVL
ncbi:baseplate J/gp47 family protein [Novosphingobium sp. SL115]|uniref:baseplate assembly protein n=1 Tax=Novosphingobium sp. SL115 TaxID=2995150 RepID=UPI002275B03A|nr:baseplate J/gp47 family protein [Novosphingobium sp. SL115]MCY1672113.1 baseplate J/gp47 family protein [Novosphingobium sp. SL115]